MIRCGDQSYGLRNLKTALSARETAFLEKRRYSASRNTRFCPKTKPVKNTTRKHGPYSLTHVTSPQKSRRCSLRARGPLPTTQRELETILRKEERLKGKLLTIWTHPSVQNYKLRKRNIQNAFTVRNQVFISFHKISKHYMQTCKTKRRRKNSKSES